VPHASIYVGGFEVVPLCDGWAPLPLADECPGQEVDWGAERTRFPWAFAGGDSWAWHVHAFAVRGGSGVVLIDTGIGSLGTPPYDVEGRIEEELRAAGIDPAEVTSVVYTHLHADHAGGACTASGRPRFPNAVHDVHEADWRFFAASDDREDFSAYGALSQLSEAGAVHLSSEDGAIAAGITAVHTPGHTPGHRSVLVRDGDECLLLTGDLLHVPPQVEHPGWPSSHDEDPSLACSSRAAWLARAREERWRVGVSHFGSAFGTVGSDGWSSD
jgi:glyoxylase-like metal-dependent hydrolase (beta-lactamase superfamily II)